MQNIHKNRRVGIGRPYGPVLTFSMLALPALIQAAPARADYTVVTNPQEKRGKWQGWGCSLAWWGHALGKTAYRDLYADLIFSRKKVRVLKQELPGLGFNIVRYNVGGGGQGDTVTGKKEAANSRIPWFKDIDGFWINPQNPDPTSTSWDWTRDEGQRAMLEAARKRDVDTFEVFSNAPMWWMMDSNSSAGGHLLAEHRRDHARYLAEVVKRARDQWGIPVSTVEPFNEPAAGWWNFPVQQEGANIPRETQSEVLSFLREELDARKLKNVKITASDENTMTQAISTYKYFQGQSAGTGRNVADLVDQVNVHAYRGLEPWRDNKARQSLRELIGNKRLWMSEYGDHEGGGITLAQTIMEDINYLRPDAWVYWQPVEPYSAWGLVNATYAGSRYIPSLGAPAWVYDKYYVMAQFSRFLRPGYELLGNSDGNSIVAHDPQKGTLLFITVNYGNEQQIVYDLSAFKTKAPKAKITMTNTDGSKLFDSSQMPIKNNVLQIRAQANSIYSITIEGVRF